MGTPIANPIKRNLIMVMALHSNIALEIIVGRLLLLTFQQRGWFWQSVSGWSWGISLRHLEFVRSFISCFQGGFLCSSGMYLRI